VTEGFNEVLLEAFAEVSEQVDSWQAVAEATEHTLEWFEEELSSRSSQIDESLGQLDVDLADQDFIQAEQRIDEVQGALAGVDALLVRMRVLTETAEAAAARSTLGIDRRNLYDTIRSVPVLPKVDAGLPGEDADISDDEWAGHLSDAVEATADAVRAAGSDVDAALSTAVGSVTVGLSDVLQATMMLYARSRRLQEAYDEWFAVLGSLSNVAPDRLSGMAAVEYDAVTAWSNRSS
jgi:enamine deaminase RidA (YjgF/YER057c/UK114 family)